MNYGAGQCEGQDSALQELHVSVQTYILPLLCVLRVVSGVPCTPACLRFPTPRSLRAESGPCAVDFVSPESDWAWMCSSKHTQESWGGDVRGWQWAERSG